MFSILTVLSAGVAALVLILHQYRFKRGLVYWLNSAMAFLVLCQTVLNAALIAQVQYNITDGFIVPSGYTTARYIVFAAITAVFLILLIKAKTALPGIAVAASFLTLPLMEAWTGRAFPVAFSVALAILIVSGVWLTVKIRGELITSISSLSIKQAMDSLHTAVMFYRKNGHILMQNSKMQELMIKTSGRVLYNGKLYLETVVIPNAERNDADIILYKLPDSEWLFRIKTIPFGRKTVTQLTAADVTEQNRENVILQKKQKELKDRQEQLKSVIKNIEETCRSEELLRIKTEIHDAQNIKLTTFLQYLRYGELPEGESFDAIRESVLRGIKDTETAHTDPKAMLDVIVNQYGRIGVKVCIDGNLPPEQDIAIALVQILQEAVANAVTHGYANEITVEITDDSMAIVMRVTDNSALPSKEIREGGGITGSRQRAEKLGGELNIGYTPRFTLTVSIPRKEGIRNE